VVEVEKITGIRREDLRPDLYREHESTAPATDSLSPFTGRIEMACERDAGDAAPHPSPASDPLSPFTGRIDQTSDRDAA